MNERRFPHHRLEAYHQALELVTLAKEANERIPRGFRSLADQLLRSTTGVALLTAEGANRYGAAQKRQRYNEARGECGEAAATVEILTRLGIVSQPDARRFQTRAARIGALLTGLIRRFG